MTTDLDAMKEYEDGAASERKFADLHLTTKGLSLVPITKNITDYSHWLNDPEVVKYSELRHTQHTWEECQAYIDTMDFKNNFMWAIYVLGPNMHIGNITLHLDPYNNVAQMGILIGEKWAWGRKYGREAWAAVMSWAEKSKIRRILS